MKNVTFLGIEPYENQTLLIKPLLQKNLSEGWLAWRGPETVSRLVPSHTQQSHERGARGVQGENIDKQGAPTLGRHELLTHTWTTREPNKIKHSEFGP